MVSFVTDPLGLTVKLIYFYLGSRPAGYSTYRSNLNIYIEIGNTFFTGLQREHQQAQVVQLAKLLRADKNWDVEMSITNTVVPFIRCRYKPKKLNCDIVFNSGIGVIQSKLMKHLLEIQPEMLKLIHFLRRWIHLGVGKNNWKQMFKPFQLFVMVVFFLQQGNYLPAIRRMQMNLPVECIGGKLKFRRIRSKNSILYFSLDGSVP